MLHGVSLRVDGGRGGGAARPERGGEDHHDPDHRRLHAAAGGRVVLDGQADPRRWPPHRIARPASALVPQGRRIFAPLSVRENLLLARGRTVRRRLDPRARLRAVPAPARAAGAARRHALRRRAADAGHRPRAHDQPAGSCSWTSRPRGWPRWSCARSARSWRELKARAALDPARRAEHRAGPRAWPTAST